MGPTYKKRPKMDDGGEVKPSTPPPAPDPDKVKGFTKGFNGGVDWAEGGEIKEGPAEESDPDDEIHGMLGEEIHSAIESKDKKKLMQGLEALIMSCMNKRGEE